MAARAPHERFGELTYQSFQDMARDPSLSEHERSGFPDEYRAGSEEAILTDIVAKLTALQGDGATVVDIGCGANPLSDALRELCARRHHRLLLIDGPDVLARHPEAAEVFKLAGRFPDLPELSEWNGQCDAVLAYSVLQYAFADASVFGFVDAVLAMLAPQGRALIADLPNVSMRRRFLSGDAGRAHHRAYTSADDLPDVTTFAIPAGELDDAAVLALAARARSAGFHAWVLPQPDGLPMANRREDLVLERP